MTCIPTGSPSLVPIGTDAAGSPASDAGMVQRSARYMLTGSSTRSPSGNATVGEVALTSTSTSENSADTCSRTSVRTFCAVP